MPFVENCEYIKPFLEELYNQGIHREGITKIFMFYKQYQKAVDKMVKENFKDEKPKQTTREAEIAQLSQK